LAIFAVLTSSTSETTWALSTVLAILTSQTARALGTILAVFAVTSVLTSSTG